MRIHKPTDDEEAEKVPEPDSKSLRKVFAPDIADEDGKWVFGRYLGQRPGDPTLEELFKDYPPPPKR